MPTDRHTVSITLETMDRIKQVQRYLEKENGFKPSVSQVIFYLTRVHEVCVVQGEKL